MKVKWGYCTGCERGRWLILDENGRWAGCRRSRDAAARFALRKAIVGGRSA